MKKRLSYFSTSPLVQLKDDFTDYLDFWHRYLKNRAYIPFSLFESCKDVLVVRLYKDRGQKA